MSTYGEEVPADLHIDNLTSWRTPTKGSKSGEETWWSSSPQSTAPSVEGALDDSSSYHGDPAKDVKKKRPCRCICLTACLLLVFLGLGLGLGLGLREEGAKYPPEETLDQVQECTDLDSEVPCCNGLESNCRLRVNEITFAASHNSMSAEQNGFLAANHRFPLEDSLEAGYRALFMDVCLCGDKGLQLCHSACKAGTRDPMVVFSAIRDFLQTHPTEVIIVELQVNEPIELVANLYGTMLLIDGLVEYMYQHPDRSTPWPLMGELVANNTRLIMFQHDGPNCFRGECPPGFHTTYGYMFETSFDLRGVEDVEDFNSSCLVTRGNPKSDFFIMNHFAGNRLGLPSSDIAAQINEEAFVEDRVAACEDIVGREVNFIMVDFWADGAVPKVAQQLNIERGETPQPSLVPSVSPSPSLAPSLVPSIEPTLIPSSAPSQAPSVTPSLAPTSQEPTVSLPISAFPSPAETVPSAPTTSSTPSLADTPTATSSPSMASSTVAPSSSVQPPNTSFPTASPSNGASASLTTAPSASPTTVLPPVTGAPATVPPTTASPTYIQEPNIDEVISAAYWFQCTSEAACSNGYDAQKDCVGNDANCPDGHTCTVSCEFIANQHCYYNQSDMCETPVLQCSSGTAPCEEGGQCVNEFSFECGKRICKNSTITEDFRACQWNTQCRIDDDCPGVEMVCASYHQDCGIGN